MLNVTAPTDEDARIAAVTRRLKTEVADVPAEVIEAHVRASFDQWGDARIRDFVPIFAERAARSALADRPS